VEIEQHFRISKGLLNGFIVVGPGFDGLYFAERGFGGFRIVPKTGSGGLRFCGGYLGFAGIVVKDTSSGPRRGPSSP